MSYPIKIEITGRPFSKKNSRIHAPRFNPRTRKSYTMSLPSENYASFKADALSQLFLVKERFTGAVVVDYIFYKKGLELQDVDNAICSINDVLQDARIISNDKHVVLGSFEVVPGCDRWSTEIIIEELGKDLPIWVKHVQMGWIELTAVDLITNQVTLRSLNQSIYRCDIKDITVYQARLRRKLLESIKLRGGENNE